MHRHSYRGRKFGRKSSARQAMIAGLAVSLVLDESLQTTLPKAKETVRFTEKLITKAKVGGVANRRIVISELHSVLAGNKLVDEIAPKLTSRYSGYLKIKKGGLSTGDNAQLATISFCDDLTKVAKKVSKTATEPKDTVKKTSPRAKKVETGASK